MRNIYQSFYQSRKYLPTEDGLPPLGNAAVWAWDSVNNKVVDTNLVEDAIFFLLN
jgi:leucyl-tRNA synthetase